MLGLHCESLSDNKRIILVILRLSAVIQANFSFNGI